MATDWIKMRTNLDKILEVTTLARKTKGSVIETIGRLWALWSWASDNTLDGIVGGATADDIDRVVEKKGFALALQEVGWLEIDETGVTLKSYEKHNGASAKKRAQDASRMGAVRTAKSKESTTETAQTVETDSTNKPPDTRQPFDQVVENDSTRLDKNRIDIIHPPYPPAGGEAGERGWTFPENLQTPAFRKAWDTWLGYTAERNGGRQVPIMTLERHMLKCHELGPTEAARAIENAIAKNFREPALPGSFQPAAPKPEAPRFHPT